MFEQQVGKVEKDRSRSIMLVSGAAVLLVIGLIILVSSYVGRDVKVEMARPGSPEFDSYSGFVSVTIKDKRFGERLGINYGRILCTVRNDGERVLTGIQLRGTIIGFESEVLKDKIISPVPRQRDTLEPHESLEIDLNVEPIPDRSMIMDMLVELYALQVK